MLTTFHFIVNLPLQNDSDFAAKAGNPKPWPR